MIIKMALTRVWIRTDKTQRGSGRHGWRLRLCDLTLLQHDAQLPLDGFHLVLEPQFQLFQPDFFQLFVFCEISF